MVIRSFIDSGDLPTLWRPKLTYSTDNFSNEELRESPHQQVWSMGIWHDMTDFFKY